MENVVTKHRNLIVLVAVLFAQVLGLAVQVKRNTDKGATRLIRLWTVSAITPAEKAFVHTQDWGHRTWRSYFYLRDVRQENQRLRDENARLRLEQVRMAEDAGQAQRLQALLKFKEQFISETMAAQVIGSSGSEQSRVIYIDKGAGDGLRTDMAVITPTGIVGKVISVFPSTAQVLQINDQSSGVGAILEKVRLQGIVKGTPAGEAMMHYVMGDEKVEPGEMVLTSGGDRIFPKGIPIGRVTQVNPGSDMFLNIRLKPSARLDRLEEVLVITKVVDKSPEVAPEGPMRASEILAQRLPTVQPKSPDASKTGAGTATPAGGSPPGAGAATPPKAVTTATVPKPGAGNPAVAKPAGATKPTVSGAAAANPADAKPKSATAGPGQSASAPPRKPDSVRKPSANAAQTQPGQPGVKVIPDSDQTAVTAKPKPAPVKPATQNAKPVAKTQDATPPPNPQ